MALWLFGLHYFNGIEAELRNKEIVLGGCCLSNMSPKWACFNCGLSYYSDGVGFLDFDIIEKIENPDLFIFDLEDIETKEEPVYRLPMKIQQLLNDDFLEKAITLKSVGFHFHEGGYSSNHLDIRYLDGILIWNQYETTTDYLKAIFDKKVPQSVFILSSKIKKELKAFITNSKWKKNYFQPIMDGKQWEMKRLNKKKIKTSYGSNDFPEVYQKLLEILENLKNDLF